MKFLPLARSLPLGSLLLLLITPRASAQFETLGDLDQSAFEGEAAFGWDSRYFFRGRWFGDESAWMDISASKELADKWSGTLSLFYTDVADRDTAFSEAQVGATLSYDAGFGFFDFGLTHYRFFDGFGGNNTSLPILGNRDATEFNITFSREIWGGVAFHVMAAHDFRINGTYAQIGVGKRWQLNEQVGLGLSATTGYSLDDYYASGLGNGDDGDGFTHSIVSLTLPMEFREGVFITPHVSANFSHAARESSNALADRDGAEVFWGATLSLDF